MAVATNNHSNNNLDNRSDNDILAAHLADQAVFDARRAAAMNRDWNVEEDPDSSGGKRKYVSKEMKTPKDVDSKGQRKMNTKPKSDLKEMGTSKDANSKGQKKTNKTKKNTNKTSPSTPFFPIQSGTKVTFSSAADMSSKRCASGMSISNLVDGEQV